MVHYYICTFNDQRNRTHDGQMKCYCYPHLIRTVSCNHFNILEVINLCFINP